MDFSKILQSILGMSQPVQGSRGKNPGMPRTPLPAKAMIQDGQPGGYSKLSNRQPVTPGYEEAAQNYEAAFARGDFNSPYIIGQDPKNFGYAEDIGQYGSQPMQQARPMVVKPRSIQGTTNSGYIPLQNSGFGGGYTQNRQPTQSLQNTVKFEDILKGLRIR